MLFVATALVPQGARGAGEDVAAYKRAVEASFAQWLEALWPDAEAAGVSRDTFDANLKGLKLNWSLPHLVLPNPAGPDGPPLPEALAAKAKPLHQPEFDIPANYFNKTTLNVLAGTGRGKMEQWAKTLGAVQKQYGVPASIVVAIWGRESGFGKVDMPFDALSAIATQGFMGRRPEIFRQEVIAALKILEEARDPGRVAELMDGAMGYTQFLPSDFEKYVDFDGDGTTSGTRFPTLSARPATRCTARDGTAVGHGAMRSCFPMVSIAPSRVPTRCVRSANGRSSALRALRDKPSPKPSFGSAFPFCRPGSKDPLSSAFLGPEAL